jgi:hypothetical protein
VIIQSEQSPSLIQVSAVTNCTKNVEDFAVVSGRVSSAVRGECRQFERMRNTECGLIAPFLFALLMTLNLDIDVTSAEDFD